MLLILDTTVTFANCTHGELRLAGSSIVTKGRVEICFNGVWDTVRDNGWNTVDANVVSNQLGDYPSGRVAYDNTTSLIFTLYTIGAKVRYGAFFGRGSGPIFLSNHLIFMFFQCHCHVQLQALLNVLILFFDLLQFMAVTKSVWVQELHYNSHLVNLNTYHFHSVLFVYLQHPLHLSVILLFHQVNQSP